jgi:hypothetical protein
MFFLSSSSSAEAGFREARRDWLVDPLRSSSSVKEKPPWVLHEGLARASLLKGHLSPRGGMAERLHEIRSVQSPPIEESGEFMDVGPEEGLAAPGKHLSRLWMRFQEGHSSSVHVFT